MEPGIAREEDAPHPSLPEEANGSIALPPRDGERLPSTSSVRGSASAVASRSRASLISHGPRYRGHTLRLGLPSARDLNPVEPFEHAPKCTPCGARDHQRAAITSRRRRQRGRPLHDVDAVGCGPPREETGIARLRLEIGAPRLQEVREETFRVGPPGGRLIVDLVTRPLVCTHSPRSARFGKPGEPAGTYAKPPARGQRVASVGRERVELPHQPESR